MRPTLFSCRVMAILDAIDAARGTFKAHRGLIGKITALHVGSELWRHVLKDQSAYTHFITIGFVVDGKKQPDTFMGIPVIRDDTVPATTLRITVAYSLDWIATQQRAMSGFDTEPIGLRPFSKNFDHTIEPAEAGNA